jgi:hypothetical protein
MKKIKLFEEFINESKGLELVHAYDKDGTMYGTGELIKKQGSKSLVRFDRDTEKWFDNKDVKLVESNEIDEATTSWNKMMKGVKAGESGPWSLVAIEYNKVVGQKNSIKVRDILPAEFEEFRKQYPRAKIHIEDSTGGVVWNESIINEGEKVIKGIFGVKKVQTLIDKYGRDNGLFFKRKSDGKLYGVGSLFLDTANKDFAVIDADGDDEYIDYKDIDYVVIKESVNEALVGDKLTKKFTELTGISTWDKVTLKSESGTWTVARLWAPKDNGGMNPGLHIELTKGNSREHFQAMDEDGDLTQFGKELKKK